MNGIYGYYDTQNEYVAYIGKDSKIDENKRHLEHNSPSRYNQQQINKVIQNTPWRYHYFVLCEGNFTGAELNNMEMQAIAIFGTYYYENKDKSVFNYTKGGDGTIGLTPWCYGSKLSDEHKKKISESKKGTKLSDETKKKISETETIKYPRIVKCGFTRHGKQKYGIYFKSKVLKVSTDINKLINWYKKEFGDEITHVTIQPGNN